MKDTEAAKELIKSIEILRCFYAAEPSSDAFHSVRVDSMDHLRKDLEEICKITAEGGLAKHFKGCAAITTLCYPEFNQEELVQESLQYFLKGVEAINKKYEGNTFEPK